MKRIAVVIAMLLISFGCAECVNAASVNPETAKAVKYIVKKCKQHNVLPKRPVGVFIQESGGNTKAVCKVFWRGRVSEAYVGPYQLGIQYLPTDLQKQVSVISHKCQKDLARGDKKAYKRHFARWVRIDPRFRLAWSTNAFLASYKEGLRRYGDGSWATLRHNMGDGGVRQVIRAEARSRGEKVSSLKSYIQKKRLTCYKVLASRGGGLSVLRHKREHPDRYCKSVDSKGSMYLKLAGLKESEVEHKAKKSVHKAKKHNSHPAVMASTMVAMPGLDRLAHSKIGGRRMINFSALANHFLEDMKMFLHGGVELLLLFASVIFIVRIFVVGLPRAIGEVFQLLWRVIRFGMPAFLALIWQGLAALFRCKPKEQKAPKSQKAPAKAEA